MRILYFVPYTPTPIRTRPFNLIYALKAIGHEVTIITNTESKDEINQIQGFRDKGFQVITAPLTKTQRLTNILSAILSQKPLQAMYSWNPKLLQKITTQLKKQSWDVVHIEHLRGAYTGLNIKSVISQYSAVQTPVIWDSVDSISLLFDQAAEKGPTYYHRKLAQYELNHTREFERTAATHFDHVIVTSSRDKAYFHKSGTKVPISIIPNGVDLDFFHPPDSHIRDKHTIIFSGKLSYHANIAAAHFMITKIMPFVWNKVPKAILQLVGKDPHKKLCKLADSDPRIIITGTVPDIRPYLQHATVAVAPIVYGAGIQNKVLEAMACQTAVVANQIAVSALSVTDGHNILIANDPETFGDYVVKLINNKELRLNIADNGRKYVETRHNWLHIARQIEKLYLEIR